MELRTNRFILRQIDSDNDDLTKYLSWLSDADSNPFIEGVGADWSLEKVSDYVRTKNTSEAAILLGIFTQAENIHIGNIKLEPIVGETYAYLGILIGDVNWRGKKVGTEVISRVLDFTFEDLNLTEVRLGVNNRNLVAYKLYLKLGFSQRANLQSENSREMFIDAKSWDFRRSKFI